MDLPCDPLDVLYFAKIRLKEVVLCCTTVLLAVYSDGSCRLLPAVSLCGCQAELLEDRIALLLVATDDPDGSSGKGIPKGDALEDRAEYDDHP